MELHWLLNMVLFICVMLGVKGEMRVATAHLKSENITGSIQFTETSEGIHVTGRIVGLAKGLYGFHIHELGDISTCDAAGAHFNPAYTNHGGPQEAVRHVGDLGNVEFVGDESPVAVVDIMDTVITLSGINNILGRAFILHEREDDLGLGGSETSTTTGNAGARVACAVIGISSPSEAWNSARTVGPSAMVLILGILCMYTFKN